MAAIFQFPCNTGLSYYKRQSGRRGICRGQRFYDPGIPFPEKPAFAMEQGKTAAQQMAEESRRALHTALGLLVDFKEEKAQAVEQFESKVDRYEDELGTYLVKLSHKDLTEKDSHSLSIMLHCIGDFERISDHAVNIMESAQELYEKRRTFPRRRSKSWMSW